MRWPIARDLRAGMGRQLPSAALLTIVRIRRNPIVTLRDGETVSRQPQAPRGVDDVESVRVPYSTVNDLAHERDAKASVEPRACGSVRAA